MTTYSGALGCTALHLPSNLWFVVSLNLMNFDHILNGWLEPVHSSGCP